MLDLVDRWVKKPAFGCQECGQCLLSQTGLICPMNCPKGLRNGPCGGTLDGKCEVFADQECVWVRIHRNGYDTTAFLPPLDRDLVGTPSFRNFLSGRDIPTREPRPFANSVSVSDTGLAQRLAGRQPVITMEVASPHDQLGLAKVAHYLEPFRNLVDAVNTTSGAAGKPSLHSLTSAQIVHQAGLESIVQFCGRDHDPAELKDLLQEAFEHGHRNALMLTGDWNATIPRQRDAAIWFPMDSLQMVDMATRLDPSLHVGVAANPLTTPMSTSLDRLAAKCAAGARFTQTQVVTEAENFGRWLTKIRASERTDIHVLASIPLVGKIGPWKILQGLPGVRISPDFARSINLAANIEKAGLQQARRLVRDLFVLGVDGIHLMNFGLSADAVIDFVHETRELFQQRAA